MSPDCGPPSSRPSTSIKGDYHAIALPYSKWTKVTDVVIQLELFTYSGLFFPLKNGGFIDPYFVSVTH
jgi:hypothetical protein